MSLSQSETSSVVSQAQSQTFSMDIETDVKDNLRTYPSIGDYYRANSKDSGKPIQLQNGLSNYSSLVLGDDRISFNESILSATYRIPVEDKMMIESPSKDKTKHFRKREYNDAIKKVGEQEINRLERVMKDKLFQRSYATSSPFQVRKAFKFFDREQCLRIPIEGFTRALEFLGFQFSELQNRALFARYDTHCTGEIDYMNFITTAMFYAAVEPDFGVTHSSVPARVQEVIEAPDVDERELKLLQTAELKKVFNKVDRERKGSLNKDEFELLLMAIGHQLTQNELDACFRDLGLDPTSDAVSFELFSDWWTDSMGVAAIRKKHSRK